MVDLDIFPRTAEQPRTETTLSCEKALPFFSYYTLLRNRVKSIDAIIHSLYLMTIIEQESEDGETWHCHLFPYPADPWRGTNALNRLAAVNICRTAMDISQRLHQQSPSPTSKLKSLGPRHRDSHQERLVCPTNINKAYGPRDTRLSPRLLAHSVLAR